MRFHPPPPLTFRPPTLRLAAFRVPALRSGFDLLTLRTRCEREATTSRVRGQGAASEKIAASAFPFLPGGACSFRLDLSLRAATSPRLLACHFLDLADNWVIHMGIRN
jgi:hypothetical protein